MVSTNQTDAELVTRAQAGDRAAVEELLRRHEKQVYRFGLRMCGDEEAAKEVLQGTLLSAFQQIGSFRSEARVSTWLFSIARSFCARQHRRTRSAPLHDVPIESAGETLPAEESAAPDEELSRQQMAELVAAAIHLLPASYREAVVLRDVEGLSAEEAADVLGIGVRNLKSRLHRGRNLMKAHLAVLLGEEGRDIGGAKACPELARRLMNVGSDEVDQRACEAIESHLDECGSCAGAFGNLKATASLCRKLPGDEVPPAVQRAVRSELLRALEPQG